MKRVIAGYIGIVGGLMLASYVWNLVVINNINALLIFSLVLLLVDWFVKPIIKIVALPLNILTLGLFGLVINTAMIYLANYLYDGINLTGVGDTFLAGLVIVIIRLIVKKIFA